VTSENEPPRDDAIPIESNEEENTSIELGLDEQGTELASLREAGQALGAQIKTAREVANMTIEDASDRLKLLPEVVRALETGEIEKIGKKRLIYIEGYYRAYAAILRVEIDETRFAVDRNRPMEIAATQSGQVNYQMIGKQALTERLRERSDAIVFGLVAVMVAVVAGVVWWVWPSQDELPDTSASSVIVSPAAQTQSQTQDTELPFYMREERDSTGEAQASVTDTATDTEATIPASDNALIDLNDDETFADIQDTPIDVQTTDSLATRGDVLTATDEPNTGTINIAFSGPSWVEVYGADDARLYYRMGQAGEVASLVGVLPLTVRIGDSTVVRVRFNDVDVDLLPYTAGLVANLTLP